MENPSAAGESMSVPAIFWGLDEGGQEGGEEKQGPHHFILVLAFSLPSDLEGIGFQKYAASEIGDTFRRYNNGVMSSLGPIRKCYFTGSAGCRKYLLIFFIPIL